MIEVERVTKSFGKRRVLSELELTVDAGAVHLLVGANGVGKSTLLRILAGLSQPDAGAVRLNGHDLRDPRRALAQLSFLPQAPRFHPRLTTRQVALYYARLRQRAAKEVDAELARWEIEDHADEVTHHLSGGLRQRLALAVFALAKAPVLLLDEPGLSLDPAWRERLQQFLSESARQGTTVLVATHLLGEWEGRAGVCHLLEDGRITRQLPPDNLRDAFGLGSPDRPTYFAAAS